jgi:AcrR family transcriptional regulator
VAQPVDIDVVLDAASAIVLNDGFDSASLRAIAERSGIGETELLRLFNSPGQLFVAMLNREYRNVFHRIVDHMDRDPLGGLLSHIYGHTIGAIHESELARALYLTDPSGLNRIMREAYGFDYMPQIGVRSEFIDMMKDAGMVRHDIDSQSLSAVIAAVSAGAALMAPHAELDHLINGLTVMLHRTADTDVVDTTAGKRVFMEYASGLADN